jgi:hypothetical protein
MIKQDKENKLMLLRHERAFQKHITHQIPSRNEQENSIDLTWVQCWVSDTENREIILDSAQIT